MHGRLKLRSGDARVLMSVVCLIMRGGGVVCTRAVLCCCVSVCLSVRWLSSHHAVLLVNLSVSLIVANVVFLSGVDKTSHHVRVAYIYITSSDSTPSLVGRVSSTSDSCFTFTDIQEQAATVHAPHWWLAAYILRILIMAALWNRAIIFLPCCFFLSSIFFPRLISAAADRMSTILPHMVWP